MTLQHRRVSSGVELGKPTHFTVNAKAAGKGKLDVQFSGPAKGDAVRDVDVIDHHDNTYTVKYTPLQQVAAWPPRVGASHPLAFPPGERVAPEPQGAVEHPPPLPPTPCPRWEAAGQGHQGHDP